MNRTNDRAVAMPDLGRVRDIPDIGFLVRDTTPHAQPEAVVVSAIAQPLHGDCRTLRLNLETDEMAIVGGDVKCRLAHTSRPSVVNEYRIDLDARSRHGRQGGAFDDLGGEVTIPVGTVMELHVSGVCRGRKEEKTERGAAGAGGGTPVRGSGIPTISRTPQE